jgi:hypothetical protein
MGRRGEKPATNRLSYGAGYEKYKYYLLQKSQHR